MSIHRSLEAALLRARARLRGGQPTERLHETIAPVIMGSTDLMPCRQALYDEAQFDRIRATPPRTDIPFQLNRLTETGQRRTEALVHDFGPATVIGGRIFSGTGETWVPTRQTRVWTPWVETFREPVTLPNSPPGMRYFGHWVRDDASAYEVAAARGARVLSMVRPDWSDAPFYEDVFGQTWDERPAFRTPDLTVVTDIGFSEAKRDRLLALGARLRAKVPAEEPGRIVYLARGPSARSRGLEGEAELIATLEGQGITILYAESDPRALTAGLMEARLVITVEGSQTSHAVYTLARNGAILVIQPPFRFYNPHLEWTRLLDVPYGIVIGIPGEDGSFRVEADEVMVMAERLLTAAG